MQTTANVVYVLTPDPQLVRVLGILLEGDGRALSACSSPAPTFAPRGLCAVVVDRPLTPGVLHVLRQLRARDDPPTPLIFLADDVTDWDRIAEMGGSLFLKPPDLLTIAAMLRLSLNELITAGTSSGPTAPDEADLEGAPFVFDGDPDEGD